MEEKEDAPQKSKKEQKKFEKKAKRAEEAAAAKPKEEFEEYEEKRKEQRKEKKVKAEESRAEKAAEKKPTHVPATTVTKSKKSKPVPAQSAFVLWHREKMPSKPKEEAFEAWSALAEADKAPYKAKAEVDKARFEREKKEWDEQQEVAKAAGAGKKDRKR